MLELELLEMMAYGFGSAIILLFVYITALALLFSRYIRNKESEENKNL